MVGIDLIKKAIDLGMAIVLKTKEALEDGKVSFIEGIGIAWSARDNADVFAHIPEIWTQIKDIDDNEDDEIIAYISAIEGIPSGNAKEIGIASVKILFDIKQFIDIINDK
jgi:hypothetical protein